MCDRFDYSEPTYQIWSGINLGIRKNRVATCDCPSDPQDRVTDFNHWQVSSTLGQHPIMHGDGMLLNVLAKKVRDDYDGTSSTLFVGRSLVAKPAQILHGPLSTASCSAPLSGPMDRARHPVKVSVVGP